MIKKRETWIDICKGIAIILVVIGHVAMSYFNTGLMTDSRVGMYSDSSGAVLKVVKLNDKIQ